MSASAWLGIDVAKDTLAACLELDKRVAQGSFDNTPAGFVKLEHWLKKRKVAQVHACLEATGRYGEGVADYLHQAGHIVSVINPARLKAFAQASLVRTKTDQTDAALLAEFCRRQQPDPWQPPKPASRALRALVRRRASLLQLQQQETNRLTSGEDSPLVLASLEAVLAAVQAELDKIDQAITAQVASDPDLQHQSALLDSISGIGPTTAAALLGEIDFSLYGSARQLVAQAGLNPRQRQSGTSVHGKPRISKQGSSQLRRILYFPAISAMRYNPAVRALAERLSKRGKAKLAIVCACMRKLLHIVFGVLKNNQIFDPAFELKLPKHAKVLQAA